MTASLRGAGHAVRRLLFILLIACSIAASAAASQPAIARYGDGQLTIRIDDMPVREALALVHERTGVEFQIDPAVRGTISAQFEPIPLERALQRLLAGFSFVAIQSGNPERPISRVMVLGVGEQDAHLPKANVPQTLGVAIESPDTAKRGEFSVSRNRHGQYFAEGKINEISVEFLIDTGATTVAVSSGLAARAGLVPGAGRVASTAAGDTMTHDTRISRLTVGELTLNNVEASIVPALGDQHALLGMSFLHAFDLEQRGKELVIRERAR